MRQREPQAQRPSTYARGYRLTNEEFADLAARQRRRCAACNVTLKLTGTGTHAVDHCHTCGTVRALYCSHCNRIQGHLGDDPARVREAASLIAAKLHEQDQELPRYVRDATIFKAMGWDRPTIAHAFHVQREAVATGKMEYPIRALLRMAEILEDHRARCCPGNR